MKEWIILVDIFLSGLEMEVGLAFGTQVVWGDVLRETFPNIYRVFC